MRFGIFYELQLPRPWEAGDELRLESEVIEVRPLKSRSDVGLVKVRTTTFNQKDVPVQMMVSSLVVPRRQAQPLSQS